MTRARTTMLLLLAAMAVALLRLPFAAHHPTEWDVANYILALEQFDLQQHRPHAPGYPVYVLAGRLLLPLAGDPHRALLWLSALLSGLAVPATWLLARRFLPAGAAAWAVALAVTNPLAWFYGSVGLPGIAELAFTPLVLWALCRGLDGSRAAPLWAGLILGIAGGLRPNLLVFLGPVWLLAVLRAPVAWRVRGASAAVLITTVLAWLVPMVIATGGPDAYLAAGDYLAATAGSDSVLLSGSITMLIANAVRFLAALSMALGLVGLCGLPLLRRLRGRAAPPGLGLVALAAALPTAFFLLIYFHKKAYVLVLVAPLLVLALAALVRPGRRVPHLLLAASCVLGNALYFLLPAEERLARGAAGHLVHHEDLPLLPRAARHWLTPTWASLRARDRRVGDTDAAIGAVLARQPDAVLVVPGEQPYDVRTLMLRWPEVEVWSVAPAGTDVADGWSASRCRHGRLDPAAPGAFAAALAEHPSLWLVETAPALMARLLAAGGRVIEAAPHRLVLRPPG